MPEAVAPAAPANGAPRNNSGQFSPKAGATGVAPPEEAKAGGGLANAPPPSGPQSVEDWGLEGEIDVYGEKQKVSFKSKAEALRELQVAAALKKRVRDIQEAEKRIAERERTNPNLTPEQQEARFRQQVLQRAQLEDMTPEQRENFTLKQQLAQFQRAQQEAQQAEKQRVEQARVQQVREQRVGELEQGLEMSGLPKTHSVMALLAEIQQDCVEQGLPPLPSDLLAKEANKRYAERGVEPLKAMGGTPEKRKALRERLGADIIREILLSEREARGLAAATRQPTQSGSSVRETPAADSEKVYGEAEAAEMLRQMRNQRR